MGRHSSPSGWQFYRSLVAWALPWVLVGAVVIALVVVAVNALNPDAGIAVRDNRPPAAVERTSPLPAETPDSPGPSPKSTGNGPERDTHKHKRKATDGDGLITAGITVQVLNATGGVEGAAAAMADRLAGLGYEIIAINTGLGNYDQTVVYWSTPESEPAAEALAQHFGWIAKPRLANLSTTVDLHVVVGLDEV